MVMSPSVVSPVERVREETWAPPISKLPSSKDAHSRVDPINLRTSSFSSAIMSVLSIGISARGVGIGVVVTTSVSLAGAGRKGIGSLTFLTRRKTRMTKTSGIPSLKTLESLKRGALVVIICAPGVRGGSISWMGFS